MEHDYLRQLIERAEYQIAANKDGADDLKEIYAEAKASGFDTKVMRKLIAIRKRRADDLAEEEAIMDMYKAAMGMV